ncbi:MAG TPA: M20/M25/M40 family metallo-hydrolase, partial [Thermoanaerobaculia bacterium]|nr:M20/M25/M40 family metallo-hydrolase [Thermoanaerobaculia bacterium]
MSRFRILLAAAVLLAAVALAALWWYNRRTEADIQSNLYIPRPVKVTPEIKLLQQYVRIDTTAGHESEGARFLAALLERNGVQAEVIASGPGRANVYARLKGRRSGEGLLLLNHIDVMPAPPKGWTHPPFAGDIALNQLWGRGALDMKSIGLCELEAFISAAHAGRPPERDLVFLAVADEEHGGTLGTQWLFAHRPDIFQGVRYALNEGGVTETRAERLAYFGVEVGTKMSVRLRLRAPSRARMQQVRIALEPYLTPPDPERVLPEVRAFLHQIAPQRIEQKEVLENLPATIREGKFWLLSRGYKELTQNVVWAGKIDSDARGATMDVNLYSLPDENPDARIAWLRSEVATEGASIEQVLEKNGPAPLSSPDTPFFHLIAREVGREYGNVPVGIEILAAFGNDSRFLRVHGITAYGMWPFPVDYFQSLGIHGIDERVRLDWFMDGVALMRRI